MSSYALDFQGKTFTPDGRIEVASVEEHNKQVEAEELARLKAHPEKVFLYVRHADATPAFATLRGATITTWLGTVVSSSCEIGARCNVGFGFHTYRRAVDCTIFGVRYVGWYMESSGQYCRLRKAKRQQ